MRTRTENSFFKSWFRTDALPKPLTPLHRHGIINCGFLVKAQEVTPVLDRSRENAILIYIFRGKGRFHLHHTVHQVGAGDFLVIPPEEKHSLIHEPDGQWAECFLGLNPQFFNTLLDVSSLSPDRAVLHTGIQIEIFQHFEFILNALRTTSPSSERTALLRAHQLILQAQEFHESQKERNPRNLIQKACVLLNQKLSEDLDLRKVATQLHLSYERFRKVFRQEIGLAPQAYRIQCKIRHAGTLILQSNKTSKEIAFELGYPDPFTFSKQFKQVMGVTPIQFRKTFTEHLY
jgi:AraC family transcriptional regulator, arabinose operon regulatory protein